MLLFEALDFVLCQMLNCLYLLTITEPIHHKVAVASNISKFSIVFINS